MLKWTSESEYFLSFENFFADTIVSSWLSKNRDENSRMREISYSKSPATCAHARILVAIFGQPTGKL